MTTRTIATNTTQPPSTPASATPLRVKLLHPDVLARLEAFAAEDSGARAVLERQQAEHRRAAEQP